jgi:hypothetical protein
MPDRGRLAKWSLVHYWKLNIDEWTCVLDLGIVFAGGVESGLFGCGWAFAQAEGK